MSSEECRDEGEDPTSYLFSLERHGIKLGLRNIKTLCAALGHPERSFASIIVAGTNGKGSVASMVERALRATGLVTGCFTSPHLSDVSERFVVDGLPVDQSALERATTVLQRTVADLLATGSLPSPPTFFEATTAIAFLLFRRAGVQTAILEVGMGGRFDATNIVDPIVAVVTSVDLDHQQFLGDTLDEIAFEKAGVIKPRGIVVTGETKEAPLGVLRRACRDRGARLIEAESGVDAFASTTHGVTELSLTTPSTSYGPVALSLRGQHQVRNAVIAVRTLEAIPTLTVPPAAICAGLSDTCWPGRLELVQWPGSPVDGNRPEQWLLLDAAHNVAAATALNAYLEENYPGGLPLVLAIMKDKDAANMLTALKGSARRFVCTEVAGGRGRSADQLAALAREHVPDASVAAITPPIAALESALETDNTVCVAGSIFLVGEVRSLTMRNHAQPRGSIS